MSKRRKPASPYRTYSSSRSQPGPARRLLFTVLMLLLPFMLLLIFESFLRVIDFGPDLDLARVVEEEGEPHWQINQNVGRRYFGADTAFARQTAYAMVPVEKRPDTYRLVCLGGSSMAGFPYNQNATMPGFLQHYLARLFPTKNIEIINLGIAAVNSYAVRDLATDVLELEPDAILVYAGHNEFYGALGVGSNYAVSSSRWLTNLYLKLIHYRTFALLQRIAGWVGGLFSGSPPAEGGVPVMQKMAAEQQIPLNSDGFATAVGIFRENLRDVVAIGNSAGVPVVIGDLVSNIRDHPPFIGTEADPGGSWRDAYARGVLARGQGTLAVALAAFGEAYAIDSLQADLSFEIGHALLAAGDSAAADRAFRRARDLDLLRFRAPEAFNAVLREVSEHGCVARIDSAFRLRSAGGVIGGELITEHLHPNARGYAIMAKAFLATLLDAGLLPGSATMASIRDLPEDPLQVGATVLDLEIGRKRIASLTAAWPFEKQVLLPSAVDSSIRDLVDSIATEFIQRRITWEDAHIALAESLEKRRLFQLARREYEAVLALHPREHEIYERLGELHLSEQQHQQAVSRFARAIELEPGSSHGFAGLGKTMMFLGKFEEARAALEKALAIDDARSEFSAGYRSFLFYLWGGALTNLRRYAEAEARLVEALRLNPGNTLADDFLKVLRQRLQQNRRN